MPLFKHMSKTSKQEESYASFVASVVQHILETTGTGGVAGVESSMGTMRYQDKPPAPLDLKLEPANIKTIPSIYKNLVPTRSVVSKENFNYDKSRGERLVQDQYAKTAEWLKAIMQGQARAKKEELSMQKKALELTGVQNAQKLDFEKQKLGLDAKRMALKAKFAASKPQTVTKQK